MKKCTFIALATVSAFISNNAFAYSSLSAGIERLKYEELTTFINPTNPNFGKTLKTSTTISSPVYRTGSLTSVNESLEFSLDASSTLLPIDDTETWKLDGIETQTSQVDMLHSTITLIGHFLLNKKHRLLLGPSYTLNTFKRFGFPTENLGVIEERSASLMLDFGYCYESMRAEKKTINYSAKMLVGIPVYQLTQNTRYPGFEFREIGGYNVDLGGDVTYPIWGKLEAGLFATYSLMKRDGERIYTDQFIDIQSIVWPENKTTILSGGLILIWGIE